MADKFHQTIIEQNFRKNIKWKNLKLAGLVGKGKHGTCFIYNDLKNPGQSYAVKLIKFDGSPSEKASIQKEIEILDFLSDFKMENYFFPSFYGYCQYVSHNPSDQHFYALVFEKASGDLRSLIKSRKSGLTFKENLALLECLSKCLVFLQKNEKMHRDLKPENILYFIDEDNEVNFKITDFGEAKLKVGSDLTVRGTPKYFAPEVNYCYLNGKSHQKIEEPYKIDIYSVGLIMIYVNLLELPFKEIAGKNSLKRFKERDVNPFVKEKGPFDKKIMRAIHDVLHKFRRIKRGEKSMFKKILRNCLKYNPNQRYDPETLNEKINALIVMHRKLKTADSEDNDEEEKTKERNHSDLEFSSKIRNCKNLSQKKNNTKTTKISIIFDQLKEEFKKNDEESVYGKDIPWNEKMRQGQRQCVNCMNFDDPRKLIHLSCAHLYCPRCLEKDILLQQEKTNRTECLQEGCHKTINIKELERILPEDSFDRISKRMPRLSYGRNLERNEESKENTMQFSPEMIKTTKTSLKLSPIKGEKRISGERINRDQISSCSSQINFNNIVSGGTNHYIKNNIAHQIPGNKGRNEDNQKISDIRQPGCCQKICYRSNKFNNGCFN